MNSKLYSTVSPLLAGVSMLAIGAFSAAHAEGAPLGASFHLAQAAPDGDHEKGEPRPRGPAGSEPAKPPAGQSKPAAPPRAAPQPSAQERPAPGGGVAPTGGGATRSGGGGGAPAGGGEAPAAPPATPPKPTPPAAQNEKKPERPAASQPSAQPPAPAAQGGGASAPAGGGAAPSAAKPAQQPTPPAAQTEKKPEPPAASQPAAPHPAPAAQGGGAAPPPAAHKEPTPASPTRQGATPPPAGQAPAPAASSAPPAPAAAPAPTTAAPAPTTAAPHREGEQPAARRDGGAPGPAGHGDSVSGPPQGARDAGEFIRHGNAGGRDIQDIRQERRETREGDRIFIREPGRTIIREGDRTIIRHNELDRFAIGARNIDTQRRGDRNVTIIERPNGVRVVTVTDDDGHLIRRVRRDPDGREIVIIDNSYSGPRRPNAYFVDVAPPQVRLPRERYILEAEHAQPADIYGVLMAPPVARLERRYTLDQVRYSQPLRQYMPRVDLDVTFDSGSWQLTPAQFDRLAAIAQGLNRAIEKNPGEVFLVEGHTDAVGSDVDNLSLSDRRAEAVAVALTEQFRVPAENLITQGYGEQYLKVQSEGDERANRRVAVRRITPLIEQAKNQRQR